MSRLEELIAELCPDGVEYKNLWEVTTWDKKFNAVDREKQREVIKYPYLLAAELFALESDNGEVFLLSTGEQTGWTTEELAGDNLCEGEVVTIPWGKSRPVRDVIKYYKGKFVTADNRIATSNNSDFLMNKFLYYWMMSQSEVIDSFYRGSGIKHPSMKDVLNMEIPVPPLPIQEEIVRILDSFTELKAELTAELTARKKQYEYYKHICFDNIESTIIKHITDIALVKARVGWQKLTKSEHLFIGEYALITGTDFKTGGEIDFNNCVYVTKDRYDMDVNIQVHKNDILITKDGTLGKVAFLNKEPEKPTTLNSGVFRIKITDENVLPGYVYHYFTSKYFTDFVESVKTSSTIPHLTQKGLVTLGIPIPQIEEQNRIVNILDKFNELVNDISHGLPAEIEARQKQYEYYRDKLLTFKEKVS